MNNKEFLIEAWRAWVSRRLSRWAAAIFILTGITALTPQLWYGLANALFMKFSQTELNTL